MYVQELNGTTSSIGCVRCCYGWMDGWIQDRMYVFRHCMKVRLLHCYCCYCIAASIVLCTMIVLYCIALCAFLTAPFFLSCLHTTCTLHTQYIHRLSQSIQLCVHMCMCFDVIVWSFLLSRSDSCITITIIVSFCYFWNM